jgi:hypothetical protein
VGRKEAALETKPNDPTVEADDASPDDPGPGDSEGGPPQEDEPIREEEDLED